ncbi:MAG: RNA polymerase sigma factor [Dysgonomonas sp.]
MSLYNQNDNISLIWAKMLTGNKEAYAQIYEIHIQSMFRYGLQFSSDPELVKDAIQDVFVNIYSHRHKLPMPDNIKLYLFITLKNILLNTLKREARYINIENAQDHIPHLSAEDIHIIEEDKLVTQQRFDCILNQLTPHQREIIHCRFVENMSIGNIAILMNINYQTVANIIQRIIRKIKS